MVKVENITYSYGRSLGNVLEQIGFEINDGGCVAILGNNGAGKSIKMYRPDSSHQRQYRGGGREKYF